MVTETPSALCPCCKTVLNRATAADGEQVSPIEGDISVCFQCASPLYYGEGLLLKKLPDEEYEKLPSELKDQLDHLIIKIKWKDA